MSVGKRLMTAPTAAGGGVVAYIGLGSNLSWPQRRLQRAVATLRRLPQSRLLAHSPWYRSAAVGPGVQPDYLNGVAALRTTLAPRQLLRWLQRIERRQRRRRRRIWGPRTLDLDLLLYGQRQVRQTRLIIPHPQLGNRSFVVQPLCALAPQLRLPDGSTLRELAARLPPLSPTTGRLP